MSRAVVFFIGMLAMGTGFMFSGNAIAESRSVGSFHSEPAAYRTMRMNWWRQSRVGLFIHWGFDAEQGRGDDGNCAWLSADAYDAAVKRFDPIRFNAAEWVDVAKRAGMKYLVVTGKDCDGFCLFDSALTDYDIIDAAPFKRDVLKELSEECRRRGLKFGVYYSIVDRHHSDYLPQREGKTHPAGDADFERYIAYMKGQLQEIITQYDPAALWFGGDRETPWNKERGQELYHYLRDIKPDIVISGLAGACDPNSPVGDFSVLERDVPAASRDYDWETRLIIDGNQQSCGNVVCKLVDVVSQGGNLCIDVMPTPEGALAPEVLRRLREVGGWMRTYGDSIYGTTASRFRSLSFGRSTTKGNRIYIHILNWPQDGRIILPGLMSNPVSATFLKDPNVPVGVTLEQMDVALAVPDGALDPLAATIELEFENEPEIIYGPDIFPETTAFVAPIDITLGDFAADDSYRIYYTLDGSDPNTSSLYYEEPFTLRSSATISCQKIAPDGMPLSPISRKTFIRQSQPQERNKPQ